MVESFRVSVSGNKLCVWKFFVKNRSSKSLSLPLSLSHTHTKGSREHSAGLPELQACPSNQQQPRRGLQQSRSSGMEERQGRAGGKEGEGRRGRGRVGGGEEGEEEEGRRGERGRRGGGGGGSRRGGGGGGSRWIHES